jgi:hypothetical protein
LIRGTLKTPRPNAKRQRKPLKQQPKRKLRKRQPTNPPHRDEKNILRDEG